MADVSVLEVLLDGELIGTLTRVAGDRSLFAFNEAYIDNVDRVEDFAQIFGIYPADKYKNASAVNIARVIATAQRSQVRPARA